MKVKVTKRWWQFWLPRYLHVDLDNVIVTATIRQAFDKANQEMIDKFFKPKMDETTGLGDTYASLSNEPSAIEANEAEPWYNSEPSESDSVVTAEPDLVAKNRGNQLMHDRLERRD